MDAVHKLTESNLKELEERIRNEYAQASKEVEAKAKKHFKDFERKDAEKVKKLNSGEITKKEYQDWRYGQTMTGQRWNDLRDSLAETMTRSNEVASKMIQGHAYDVYALNHNYGTYECEKGTGVNTSYILYDKNTVTKLAKDNPDIFHAPGRKVSEAIKRGETELWNKRHVQSVMLQGVLQGESIPKIAKRLASSVSVSNMKAAVRDARTITTCVQNAGRLDSYQRALEMGIMLEKKWEATADDRTRKSHQDIDGEVQPIDQPFSNGLMYPAESSGDADEVYNCRCTMVAENPRPMTQAEIDERLKGLSFDEWEEEHQVKHFNEPKDAYSFFGERPDRSLRKENRELYNKLVEKYNNSTYSKWRDSLTDEQFLSINAYTGDAYSPINGMLRGQMTKKQVYAWNQFEKYTIEDMVDYISGGIDKFELKESIKVYRTCENDVLENLQTKVGSLFHDEGFGSTTVVREKKASGNIFMEIEVPKGKGVGAWVTPISGSEEEYEFLLQRGANYRVQSISQNGGDTVIKMKVEGYTKNDWHYATREEVIERWKRQGTYDEMSAKKI